jgi:hypothetical protein
MTTQLETLARSTVAFAGALFFTAILVLASMPPVTIA